MRHSNSVSFAFFVVSHMLACGESSNGSIAADGSGGAGIQGGSGGASASSRVGANIAGNGFNQCGVAAPLPVEASNCTVVTSPSFVDFDDYNGAAASSYTFYVNAKPPEANALLVAIQHIGDGSDQNGGTSVIATEMVTGEGGNGYALQFSDSNATHWGGLLMFYLPGDGTTTKCLNVAAYSGLEFSIRGTSPSGRFGVNLGMLDTIPTADKGLCNNSVASDCKDATIELNMPASAETWSHIQIPWSSFTPGIGSGLSCVPLTGQNIVRLVIQPFMNYPPPNYTMAPGPYAILVDNVRFY